MQVAERQYNSPLGNRGKAVVSHTKDLPPVERDTGSDTSSLHPDSNRSKVLPTHPVIEEQATTTNPTDVVMCDEPKGDDADLLLRIRGLYRLLDLISEQGSRGAVDKVIIAHESVARFVNDICPGAYTSMTKVDLNALDSRDMKPIGVYGSISAIVDFLRKAGRIDEETALLLLAPPRPVGAAQQPILRPGLYLLHASKLQPNVVYIIFWPEETTWHDHASEVVSRNRTTFMRFLTKLCDQVVALISDQHSEKLDFTNHTDVVDNSDRLYDFDAQQTGQQEESATASEGFKFSHTCMAEVTECPKDFDLEQLQPILVAGDTLQAVLSAECVPKQYKKEAIGSVYPLGLCDILKTSRSPRLILDESMTIFSLKILLQHGLNQRCPGVYQSWRAEKTRDDQLMKQRESDAIATWRTQLGATLGRIQNGIMKWLAEQAVAQYPSLTEEFVIASIQGGSSERGILSGDLRYLKTEEVHALVTRNLHRINDDPKSRFCTLKKRFCQHYGLLQMEKGFTNERVQRMIDILGTHGDYEAELQRLVEANEDEFRSDQPNTWSKFISRPTSKRRSVNISNAMLHGDKLAQKDDTIFLTEVCTMIAQEPAYRRITEEILQEAADSLGIKLKRLEKELLQLVEREIARITRQEIDEQISAEKRDADQAAKAQLRSLIRATLDAEEDHPTNRNRVIIRGVSSDKINYQETFRVDGETIVPIEAGICYKFNVLEVKKPDTIESNYIPQLFIRRAAGPNFTLPPSHDIRFIRLIGSSRCLLVVQDPQGALNVYLETLNGLGQAVKAKPKKIFHSDRLGSNPLFALDEVTRILVIYASVGNHAQIIMYTYENASNTLSARGGAINITRWFDGPSIPQMLHATFISGIEELLMVDETGLARIFSLVTEQFRPVVCKLDYLPASIHTVPDGAAFLALEPRSDEPPRLLCYHLASFGSGSAIPIELPEEIHPSANMVVSFVGRAENPHAILLDYSAGVCSSVSLHIASNTSGFDFRAGGNRPDSVEKNTVHNSLIDCHSDVWTRYPIQAAICRETATGTNHRRRSITFISPKPPANLSKYFKALVRDFEQKSRKPTTQLAKINIAVQSSFDPTSHNLLISQFKAGDWLVGLFCLIPIHLAVTGQNRFIPLRDGVISQEFEQSLLGEDVGRIAEALSLGWYESIFASYLARKPVKVVTSMGEQFIGKSYALNHFVDTSFAVSAMRCTEGVWLSVTPTQDALIVSMDFEGVNSIERSAQEDALLVLFNVAISNLVLFRNNFALSRDIGNSFKSFQLSPKVLDPVANPILFQSTLAIIIKDVIDSDAKEIVDEFALKFEQIVRDDAGDNFISKLYRGKPVIISWPVIQSTRFYELFGTLRAHLEKQPVTHRSAGEFLRVLKMLMAKLKVCDWGEHDDAHDCYTTRKCPHACDDQHDGLPAPACDIPAGHNGKHICGEMSHQCGQLRTPDLREGCLQSSPNTTTETLHSSPHQIHGSLKEYSPVMSGSTGRVVEKVIKDATALDQARVLEILDKFAAQGSDGTQKLVQEVIASFNLYSGVPETARLLNLVDSLVVYSDDTFRRQLAEGGFFQTLISDERVQSDQKFRTHVQAHLATWLGNLSGRSFEIASDILRRLSDSSKGESPTDRQLASSNPGPLDQPLSRSSREVITFPTPKLEKRPFKFLLSSYIQAGDILRKSRRVKWFSLQAVHIVYQAFHLIIRFNGFIGPDGPTNEHYDEGMDLDDALEELEDKIDELEKLELDEAIRSEDDHKYDLARLYQIFFTTRDFYPNGRDYKTDPVLKRLADSDHATLILARRVQARDPHTEGSQDPEVHGEGDGSNQGPILDMGMSKAEPGGTEAVLARNTDSAPPPTKEQQESTATPAFGRNVENSALRELRPLDDDEEDLTINDVESLKRGIIKTSKNVDQAEYTILLVGQTGVGKSTFLEFLANVIIGNNIDCYNFEVLDPSNEQHGSSNQNQTNSARLYEFTSCNGIVVRILDTPGLADTRGIEYDELHKRSIAAEIRKHIDSVTAVLVLANGTVPQITAGTDYALSTLSAILPKSLIENIGFVFTNVSSPLAWNFSEDTLPDVLRDAEMFLFDNPVVRQEKYLAFNGNPHRKQKFRKIMRKEVLGTEERALEMLVNLFDWLDGLRSHPSTEIVYLYDVSQSVEAMIMDTFAQMDQTVATKAEIDKLVVTLKNNSKDMDAVSRFKNTTQMAVWKQQWSSTINMICGQANCYSNCYIDYESNIPHDLGFPGGVCGKCNHNLSSHYCCIRKWGRVINRQASVDQNMKKWEEAKDETEKTAILVAVRKKVLHNLNQIINGATYDLAHQVERYSVLSLLGSPSAQVGSAVRFLEHINSGLEEKGVGQVHLARVKESLGDMKRKLELLTFLKRGRKESRG